MLLLLLSKNQSAATNQYKIPTFAAFLQFGYCQSGKCIVFFTVQTTRLSVYHLTRIFPSFMGLSAAMHLFYIYNYNPFSANKGILVHLKEEKQLHCLVNLPDGLFGFDRVKVEQLAEEIYFF